MAQPPPVPPTGPGGDDARVNRLMSEIQGALDEAYQNCTPAGCHKLQEAILNHKIMKR